MFIGESEKQAFLDGIFKGANGLPKNNPYPQECRMFAYYNDGYKTGKKYFIYVEKPSIDDKEEK